MKRLVMLLVMAIGAVAYYLWKRREESDGMGRAPANVSDFWRDTSERIRKATQELGERANEVIEQVVEQSEHAVEEAKQRMAETTDHARDLAEQARGGEPAFDSGLRRETRAAINEVVAAVQDVEETIQDVIVSLGMKVVAFDGTDIGRVKEVREDAFVMDRPKASDLLVPMDQIARVEGTVVYLRVEPDRVTKMGWESVS